MRILAVAIAGLLLAPASLATAETIDNGKPIRETTAADLPLAIDHFRYFAGAIRAQEGSIAQIFASGATRVMT